MSDEHYSIHDAMQDLVSGRETKVVDKPKEYDLEDLRYAVKRLLDKVINMDRFIRSSNYRYGGRVMDGEAYKKEVIEKFLSNLRDGCASDEEKLLVKHFLTKNPTPKEISEDCFL